MTREFKGYLYYIQFLLTLELLVSIIQTIHVLTVRAK